FLLRQLDRPAETGLAALRTALAAEADAGRTVVLLVEEAQALPSGTLAALPELILPLASSAGSPVQVLLAGRPPLSTALAAAGLRGRIGVLAHLRPLARNEVAAYIHDQLARAGARRELFTPPAVVAAGRPARGAAGASPARARPRAAAVGSRGPRRRRRLSACLRSEGHGGARAAPRRRCRGPPRRGRARRACSRPPCGGRLPA